MLLKKQVVISLIVLLVIVASACYITVTSKIPEINKTPDEIAVLNICNNMQGATNTNNLHTYFVLIDPDLKFEKEQVWEQRIENFDATDFTAVLSCNITYIDSATATLAVNFQSHYIETWEEAANFNETWFLNKVGNEWIIVDMIV